MKTYYHNDADGRCAAAIVLLCHSSMTELIEKAYNKEFDYEKIEPGEEVWLVDLAISPEELSKIQERTKKVFWFDHHKSTMQQQFSDCDGIRDESRCGAALVWDYFFPEREYPEALRLIDDYDRWIFSLGERTELFRFGLETLPHDPGQELWDHLLFGGVEIGGQKPTDYVISRGDAAIAYRNGLCSNYVRNYGFESEFEGHRCFCMNLYTIGSKAFGGKLKEYPICIGFVFDGSRYTYGLYSEKVDVSAIAKAHGGGGHPGAAGFTSDKFVLSIVE